MVVMSEFLDRGYNVAVPEVDVGDDLFVVRDSSYEYHDGDGLGSINKNGYLNLYVKFEKGRALCSGIDLSKHVNNWSEWPSINH